MPGSGCFAVLEGDEDQVPDLLGVDVARELREPGEVERQGEGVLDAVRGTSIPPGSRTLSRPS